VPRSRISRYSWWRRSTPALATSQHTNLADASRNHLVSAKLFARWLSYSHLEGHDVRTPDNPCNAALPLDARKLSATDASSRAAERLEFFSELGPHVRG
jgi:hypothetical protein